MHARLNAFTIAPQPMQTMLSMEAYLSKCGLDHTLKHLMKIRASQMNQCAYCIDMHTKDARAEGETEQRIYALSAWRETPFFTDRERAALAWTETVTRIQEGVSDDAYAAAREHFEEEELVNLTWAIAAINSWNRIAISFRNVPGSYKPLSAKQIMAAL